MNAFGGDDVGLAVMGQMGAAGPENAADTDTFGPQPEQGQALSTEQVRALLEGITPGEWQVVDENICSGYRCEDGKNIANWIAEVDHLNQDDYVSDDFYEESETANRNARLIAAAPQLARDLLATRQALAAAEAKLQTSIQLDVPLAEYQEAERDILSRNPLMFVRVAHVYRVNGHDIPPKMEEELRFMYQRCMAIAREHGLKWDEAANVEIKELVAKAQAEKGDAQ